MLLAGSLARRNFVPLLQAARALSGIWSSWTEATSDEGSTKTEFRVARFCDCAAQTNGENRRTIEKTRAAKDCMACPLNELRRRTHCEEETAKRQSGEYGECE